MPYGGARGLSFKAKAARAYKARKAKSSEATEDGDMPPTVKAPSEDEDDIPPMLRAPSEEEVEMPSPRLAPPEELPLPQSRGPFAAAPAAPTRGGPQRFYIGDEEASPISYIPRHANTNRPSKTFERGEGESGFQGSENCARASRKMEVLRQGKYVAGVIRHPQVLPRNADEHASEISSR
jgi:hypothetical protein